MSVIDKFFVLLDKVLPEQPRRPINQSLEDSIEEIFNGTSLEDMAHEQLAQVDLALLIIHNIIMPAFLDNTNINESFDEFADSVDNLAVLKLTTYWLSQMLLDAINNMSDHYQTSPEQLFMTAIQGYRQAVLSSSVKMAAPIPDTP